MDNLFYGTAKGTRCAKRRNQNAGIPRGGAEKKFSCGEEYGPTLKNDEEVQGESRGEGEGEHGVAS